MLTGQSVLHVNQDIGKSFSTHVIKGYYNNLTEKVTKEPELVDSMELPHTPLADGSVIIFPVAVFQYALGCYDLYLQTGDKRYQTKFIQLADWTLQQQDERGRWANFSQAYPDNPYGAMAQGEAASVLIRAYKETLDTKYLIGAKRSIDFMLLPHEDGGTAKYIGNDLLLMEYTHLPIVLNGWIFAWWGLYDYVIMTSDNGHYKELLQMSCNSLVKYMPQFATRYWSKYDLDYRIASPFYHNLHIAQMQAMYQLTGEKAFNEYGQRWDRQQGQLFNKSIAFLIKAYQKIVEK